MIKMLKNMGIEDYKAALTEIQAEKDVIYIETAMDYIVVGDENFQIRGRVPKEVKIPVKGFDINEYSVRIRFKGGGAVAYNLEAINYLKFINGELRLG